MALFSGSELVEVALGIEKNGIAYYDSLAELATDAALKNAYNYLADMERKMIETALNDCQGHFSRAAKKLGIHRTTLWRKIKKLGVKLPNYDA